MKLQVDSNFKLVNNSSDPVWTEVKRKKSSLYSGSDASPSPPITFRNLKRVDEIDGKKDLSSQPVTLAADTGSSSKINPVRLTKSQKKKLKAARGSSSPPLS